MGYVPDQRAQSMRTNRTMTVGLLVPDLRNPYFADLVASVEDDLYRQGVSTLIGTSSESVEKQDAFINNLLGQRIDGAIVVPQGVDSPGMRALTACGMPLVFVDRRVPGIDEVPFVVSDPVPGIQSALDSLTNLGHRRIGYVAHPSLGSFSVDERASAFHALSSKRLPDGDCPIVECDETCDSRRRALDKLLEAGVTAIICGYSPDMITMVGLLAERGIRIGEDLSAISFDDIDGFRLMVPQISVISQQADHMGHLGVETLLRHMRKHKKANITEHADDIRYVPTVYMERTSVGPVPYAARTKPAGVP